MSEEKLIEAETLKNVISVYVTGGSPNDLEYRTLRDKFMRDSFLKDKLPRFVVACRTLGEIWSYFKEKSGTYAGRREIIREAFHELLLYLEEQTDAPLDEVITQGLTKNNAHAFIRDSWDKALERRVDDPEGAITIARTLLEQTLKFIMDQESLQYGDADELQTLYKKAQNVLNLSPDGHTEQIFKQILGGCSSIIHGLGSLRNKLGDAHGHGISHYKPGIRHAELSVNLAGSMAHFLISTWTEKKLNTP